MRETKNQLEDDYHDGLVDYTDTFDKFMEDLEELKLSDKYCPDTERMERLIQIMIESDDIATMCKWVRIFKTLLWDSEVEADEDFTVIKPLLDQELIRKYNLLLQEVGNANLQYELLNFLINLTCFDVIRDHIQTFKDHGVIKSVVDNLHTLDKSIKRKDAKLLNFTLWALLHFITDYSQLVDHICDSGVIPEIEYILSNTCKRFQSSDQDQWVKIQMHCFEIIKLLTTDLHRDYWHQINSLIKSLSEY